MTAAMVVFIVVVGLLTEDRRGFNLCHVGNGTNPFPVPAMASHRMSRGRRADGRRRKEEGIQELTEKMVTYWP